METLIAKWIQETVLEIQKAKSNQNFYRMKEMSVLRHAMIEMRDKLLKTWGN